VGILALKIPLFRVSGILVQLHMMFVLFVGWEIYEGFVKHTLPMTLAYLAILWASVLLHEFGHCWGARRMGGDATEVLLWPLGGLATCEVPMTPRANFVMTAAGPAVNLVLAGLAFGISWVIPDASDRGGITPQFLCTAVIYVNIALFLFNCIPAFPMDMGRILQVALWIWIGFQRALRIAVYTSFACAGIMAVAGLVTANIGGNPLLDQGSMLFMVAIFVIMAAWGQLQMLNAGMFAEHDEPWRQTFWIRDEAPAKPRGPGFVGRFLERRRQDQERAAAEQAQSRATQLDEVLRRVAQVGMDGLTADERRFLEQESARLREKR
jgi:Zn-dependent protease